MAKPQIVKLMVDGVLVDFLVRTDANGEWACYSKPADGGRTFFFSPVGVDEDGKGIDISLTEHVKRHNAANGEKPVFAEDVPDTTDAELDAWLAGEEVEAEESDEEVPVDGE